MDLAAENRRLRRALAEVRAHVRVELHLAAVADAPRSPTATLKAIVSSVDSVLGVHAGNLSCASPAQEVA